MGNRFEVRETTRGPVGAICAQVLVPFEEVIVSNAENRAPGDFFVSVNDVSEEFTIAATNTVNAATADRVPTRSLKPVKEERQWLT